MAERFFADMVAGGYPRRINAWATSDGRLHTEQVVAQRWQRHLDAAGDVVDEAGAWERWFQENVEPYWSEDDIDDLLADRQELPR